MSVYVAVKVFVYWSTGQWRCRPIPRRVRRVPYLSLESTRPNCARVSSSQAGPFIRPRRICGAVTSWRLGDFAVWPVVRSVTAGRLSDAECICMKLANLQKLVK